MEARVPETVWTMDAEAVEERVGRSCCKVDLAVRHPEYKDCYRIGIVCDGDSYHAATTARDRDRLRTQILRGMGWSLYHVWSRAWLQDPERQKNLLLAAVNSAIESFVRPVECVPVEALIEEATIELEDDAGGTEAEPTAKGEAPSEPAPARTEYLEVEHHIEEHRYGFQSYPEYKPPRRGAISDLDLLKQFTYAQAPFSVDYFLQVYREYCYAPGQRMNATIQRSGIGYLQTKLRDTVTVRQEHGAEYVFRRLVKAHITACQIPQSSMVEAQTCLVGLQYYPQVIIVSAAF